MTFIVGMHCFDGIVMCADSLEGDGITKQYVHKLKCVTMSPDGNTDWVPHQSDWGFCLGGAGSSIGIDKFKDKWNQLIMPMEKFDLQKIELTAEASLRYMKENYSDIGFDIMLALSGGSPANFATRLYRTYEGIPCLRPIEHGEFTCLGMDTSLARFLLDALFDPRMPTEEAVGLGVLVTSLMKNHADGVGGPTTMFSYTRKGNEWHGYNEENMEDWESSFPAKDVYELLREFWVEKNPDYKDRNRYRILRGDRT
jgi:hypothetical protein